MPGVPGVLGEVVLLVAAAVVIVVAVVAVVVVVVAVVVVVMSVVAAPGVGVATVTALDGKVLLDVQGVLGMLDVVVVVIEVGVGVKPERRDSVPPRPVAPTRRGSISSADLWQS